MSRENLVMKASIGSFKIASDWLHANVAHPSC